MPTEWILATLGGLVIIGPRLFALSRGPARTRRQASTEVPKLVELEDEEVTKVSLPPPTLRGIAEANDKAAARLAAVPHWVLAAIALGSQRADRTTTLLGPLSRETMRVLENNGFDVVVVGPLTQVRARVE